MENTDISKIIVSSSGFFGPFDREYEGTAVFQNVGNSLQVNPVSLWHNTCEILKSRIPLEQCVYKWE
jgi:hypothetical protein